MPQSSGDYFITLDNDLQNPPEKMIHLINKMPEDYDVVFGRFYQKQPARYRRLGSRLSSFFLLTRGRNGADS